MNEVAHLGHVLSYNLDDTPDIIKAKVNSILCTFSAADPFVKSFLVKIYCLSLYGCPLWALNSPSLKVIETALNKLLCKVWNLPYNSHTAIVHSVANCNAVSNLIVLCVIGLCHPPLIWFTLNLLNSCTHLPVIIISMVTTMLYISHILD